MHGEVERRCQGISESLSKYLRLMSCVTLDEVVTVRDRIKRVRAKADNVVILSASRCPPSLNICLSYAVTFNSLFKLQWMYDIRSAVRIL